MNEKTIELRLAGLEAARANNAMEGLYECEDGAALLDAFARGESERSLGTSLVYSNAHVGGSGHPFNAAACLWLVNVLFEHSNHSQKGVFISRSYPRSLLCYATNYLRD